MSKMWWSGELRRIMINIGGDRFKSGKEILQSLIVLGSSCRVIILIHYSILLHINFPASKSF